MKKAALLVLIFFFSLISYFLVLPSAHAASTTPSLTKPSNGATTSANTKSDVPNTPHYSIQSTVIEIMSAITCQLSGIDPINPQQSCLGIDQISGKLGFLPSPQAGGAIGGMGNMLTMLYTPPLHTGDYFQNLAQNFGISKKTYAATSNGTGFEGLKPLLGLWTAFRNIVYLAFIIVFVVIGLAVMLRVKIDPRTVMTIQNQIPKIIVGILLVTFSYAIAGFLIDMMYTTIYMTADVITSADTTPKLDASTVSEIASSPNPFSAAESSVGLGAAWNAADGILPTITDLLHTPGGYLTASIIGGFAGDFIIPNISNSIVNSNSLKASKLASSTKATNLKSFAIKTGLKIKSSVVNQLQLLITKLPTALTGIPGGSLIGTILGNFAEGAIVGALTMQFIIPGLATLIIFLILSIALFTALFRLWFTLLMAYVQILLAVVLAPFWIIGGIIPGSPINISGWLKNLGANLAAFPVVIAMFLLGKVFQDAMGSGNVGTNFVPPLIGDRLSPDAIKGFISLGIILITPNVINILKTALKVPKVDSGLGKSLAPGLAVPGRIMGGMGGLAFGSAVEKGFMDKSLADRSPLGRFLRTFGLVKG